MIRLGTRGSALALAQARWVAERLPGEVELVPITTSGDERRGGAPELADKSRFVKEIEEALLAGEIDFAVHSAKDVPSELPNGLSIVGVPERADVRDLRGNVDTRLRRLGDGDFDAIVLAKAGLDRLGRGDEGTPLDPGLVVPAPGQGCLVLEARSAPDDALARAATELTDRDALASLTAERAVVSALDATCHTPIGAHCVTAGAGLRLTVFVGLPDGSRWIRDELDGDAADPAALGDAVGERMRAAGAAELLAEAERAVAAG